MKNDLEIIYQEGCNVWGFDIFERTHKVEYVIARSQFYTLAKKYLNPTLELLAEFSNGRSHASLVNAFKKFPEYQKLDWAKRNWVKYYVSVEPYFVTDTSKSVIEDNSFSQHMYNQAEILRKKNKRLMEIVSAKSLTEIEEELMLLNQEQRQELIDFKIKPHLQMLKSRKHYATK